MGRCLSYSGRHEKLSRTRLCNSFEGVAPYGPGSDNDGGPVVKLRKLK